MTDENDGSEIEVIEEETVAQKPRYYRRRRRLSPDGQGSSTWLISFTDVMALMLTFFVLLFAMSSPQKEKWEDLTNNVQENFNKFYGQPLNRGTEDSLSIEKVNFSKALNLSYLKAIIEKLIAQEENLQGIELIELPDRLIISLPQQLMFEAGQAEIKSEANKALFSLAGTLNRIKNSIEVVGHTDPTPVQTVRYDSNWSLSLYRALNVAAVLENLGYNKNITVRGMASGRYFDLNGDFTEQQKLSLSRRVDIVVLKDDGKRLKLFDIGMP